ncbi:protein serine/threonine phosphatase 2C [Daldinia caldariorum]|uniref:protein serine/threonine phosphatase 2C n=1 Tax=Daldinia caldariorum TaxID=326644 RepID=UPI0020089CDE|nr:protein serine/threonine phosphatase 2C [Daldinia caldariorum]KAI1471009.1 protein serine/threonine phosphatase 2C [Daldinia caldariorum]
MRAYTRRAAVRCTAARQPSISLPAPRSVIATTSHVKCRATKVFPHHSVQRHFHTYFVTHLPSSSLHPDSRAPTGPHHKLPRSAAAPHTETSGVAPLSPPHLPSNRDLTVVRIPLRSAKHHFGVADSRGSRAYNEDTNQAGTIDIPAFAKRAPISLVRSAMNKAGEGTSADSPYGDPQIFYFGVFDGHGGTQCSAFLRDELHGYIEEAAQEFELKSSLRTGRKGRGSDSGALGAPTTILSDSEAGGQKKLDELDMKSSEAVAAKADIPEIDKGGVARKVENPNAIDSAEPVPARTAESKALQLQSELVKEYKSTVGGYFRRFHPPYFHLKRDSDPPEPPISVETVLTYAFLRADLDFIAAQARKPDPDDPYVADTALNLDEVLGKPHHLPPSGQGIGGRTRFKGGSTASVALISTPTPAPFWHPAASSTLLVAHVGDTRILLCETTTGLPRPLTSDHRPSSPSESHRLRRFAASFVTDSFGEERIQGLANSRAFGDMASKRLGVSAEPEITRTELGPAQYSFLVLMSDGVSGTLGDQEIVDIVKEAKTPEQGARDVVAYATEVSSDGDNATCLVVRLGGWERRSEGGLGSLGTKEIRDFRRNEAMDPRRGIR